jgi:hypothetical protein
MKGESIVLSLAWSHPGSGPTGRRWWSFPGVVRSSSLPSVRGVYCIFQRTSRKYRTVWIGQGNIRNRLAVHAREPNISARPYLLVTWAETDPSWTDGIEAYLIDALHPLEGEAAPSAEPVEVNLPYRA